MIWLLRDDAPLATRQRRSAGRRSRERFDVGQSPQAHGATRGALWLASRFRFRTGEDATPCERDHLRTASPALDTTARRSEPSTLGAMPCARVRIVAAKALKPRLEVNAVESFAAPLHTSPHPQSYGPVNS